MLVCTHACIHAGENSRHDLYSIRKTPILEIFTVQQRQRVYNILVFLPFCYNILKLSCSLNLPNYAEIVLNIQCGMITGCKILIILLCSLNIFQILKCACVM